MWFELDEARALVAKLPLSLDEANALRSAHRKIERELRRLDPEPTYNEELSGG